MQVNVKRNHKDAVIPSYAKDGDAGLDLTAVSKEIINTDNGDYVKYGTGLSFEIPKGFVGYLFPRSSCYKKDMLMSNSVGVIDSGYRGEVSAVFIAGDNDHSYEIGDRVMQLVIMPIPKVTLIPVEKLSETDRGTGGFGSTGK